MGLLDKILANSADENRRSAAAKVELEAAFACDRELIISAPDSLTELKGAVDITDPGSVAAYWLYSVMALTVDFETGMDMLRYLYADIVPFGAGYIEGGGTGKAGWDSYFNERLKDKDYSWLPRAYFKGAVAANGYTPDVPLGVKLRYNQTNTEVINKQSESLGRTNVVYWITSHAAGNQVNITLSRFSGSDRWYVTSGSSAMTVFYGQGAGTLE